MSESSGTAGHPTGVTENLSDVWGKPTHAGIGGQNPLKGIWDHGYFTSLHITLLISKWI